MPVATTNYLWQWEHQKLGWIGLAKIPNLGTLERLSNMRERLAVVQLFVNNLTRVV